MKSMISPNFPAEKLDAGRIEDLIDVFEDRMKHWSLKQARNLLSQPDSEYAITQLLMPYFEGISIYLKGEDSKGKSEQFFIEGFLSVFSPGNISVEILKRVSKILWKDARCGFFHDNMIRSKIFFTRIPIASSLNVNFPKVNGKVNINGEISAIIINADKLFKKIDGHFTDYLAQLRNPENKELRRRFERAFKLKRSLGAPFVEIGEFENF
jgi:hypothetical protein